MNPQDLINQNIRMLIGDLQINLMVANARIQELEAQISDEKQRADSLLETLDGHQKDDPAKPNGKGKEPRHA